MFNPESIIGKQIDRFRLEEFIARGAMGLVYKAYDTTFNRTVALKIIPKGTDPTPEEAEARRRLLQEALAAGRLTHPNIVAIHSHGETDEFEYICMEFVRGRTLADVLAEKKTMEVEDAFPIFEQVLLALESANQEHIVHRDIKPSNIMIREDGRVKLMDFGIAKLPSVSITTAGTLLGTPHYMSPEQVSGQKLDIRSDLFSIGVVLYEVLTGEKPFRGESTAAIAHQIAEVEPTPVRTFVGRIPESVEAVCRRALSKDPSQRYQTPWKMLKELRSAVAGSTAWDQARAESEQTARILAASDPKAKEVSTPEAERPTPEPPTPERPAPELTATEPSAPEPPEAGPTSTLEAGPPPQPFSEVSEELPKEEVPPAIAPKVSRAPLRATALLLIVGCLVAALYFWGARISGSIKSFLGPSHTPQQSQGVSPPAGYQPAEGVDSLIARAESQWKSDPSAARQLIERARGLDPNSVEPVLHLARLLVGDGNFSAAVEQFQNVLLINAQDAEGFCGLGLCYFKLGQFDLAVENYEACWALSPARGAEVSTNLGVSYFMRNDFGRARTLLEKALEVDPGNELARSYLANIPQPASTGSPVDVGSQQGPGDTTTPDSGGTQAPAPEVAAEAARTNEAVPGPLTETSGHPASAGSSQTEPPPRQATESTLASPAQSGRIQVGMTFRQVREILGAPGKVEKEGRVTEWKYYTPKGKLEVKFKKGTVYSVRGP